MKMADVLGGKLKGAKFDARSMHRDTVKRLLKLDDSQVTELSCALHALADEEPAEEDPLPSKMGEKRPSLLAILGKGSAPEKE